jgi:hypothetical protein
MTAALHRGLGVILAVALIAGIVRASNVALATHRSSDGVLRLAWSARPERIEKCRQRTDEELARLPQHMRQSTVCEGSTAEYRLRVSVDGAAVIDRIVHGGGLRRDRRLYVFEELPLPALRAVTIAVRLDRTDAADARTTESPLPHLSAPQGQPHLPRSVESVPAHLSLERELRVAPRQVLLVTYDRQRQELTTVSTTR